jgi:hypothetical protein
VKNIAKVYITPASGVGGEWPTPIPFNLNRYSRAYVEAYAEKCRSDGQKARIVWPEKERK